MGRGAQRRSAALGLHRVSRAGADLRNRRGHHQAAQSSASHAAPWWLTCPSSQAPIVFVVGTSASSSTARRAGVAARKHAAHRTPWCAGLVHSCDSQHCSQRIRTLIARVGWWWAVGGSSEANGSELNIEWSCETGIALSMHERVRRQPHRGIRHPYRTTSMRLAKRAACTGQILTCGRSTSTRAIAPRGPDRCAV